jgi:hypothetical protein
MSNPSRQPANIFAAELRLVARDGEARPPENATGKIAQMRNRESPKIQSAA